MVSLCSKLRREVEGCGNQRQDLGEAPRGGGPREAETDALREEGGVASSTGLTIAVSRLCASNHCSSYAPP